ncbi:hypothetical protein D3C77_425640 [compost metagenome]
MRPAFVRIDIVRKGMNVLCVAVVVLQSYLDHDHIPLSFDVNRLLMKNFSVLVQIFYIFDNTAFIMEFLGLPCPFIRQRQINAFVQEGQFTNTS